MPVLKLFARTHSTSSSRIVVGRKEVFTSKATSERTKRRKKVDRVARRVENVGESENVEQCNRLGG